MGCLGGEKETALLRGGKDEEWQGQPDGAKMNGLILHPSFCHLHQGKKNIMNKCASVVRMHVGLSQQHKLYTNNMRNHGRCLTGNPCSCYERAETR